MKLYKNIDDLPLKNYFKILETGDYTYLIAEQDKNDEIDNFVLSATWQEIIEQHPKFTINANNERCRYDAWLNYYEWRKNEKKLQKYNNAFQKYLETKEKGKAYVNHNFIFELIKANFPPQLQMKAMLICDEEFEDVREAYNQLKKIFPDDYLKIRLYFLDSLKIETPKIDIYDELINIEMITGIRIEINNDNTRKYLTLKKKSIEMIKEKQKNERN